jgi:hypothetical protein
MSESLNNIERLEASIPSHALWSHLMGFRFTLFSPILSAMCVASRLHRNGVQPDFWLVTVESQEELTDNVNGCTSLYTVSRASYTVALHK